MDDFTYAHLRLWWTTTRFLDEEPLFEQFIEFIESDEEYLSGIGWSAAFTSFESVVAS